MGALSRTRVIPLADYPLGSRTFVVPSPIEDDATAIYAEFARCTSADPSIWPNQSTRLKVSCEISLDGGTEWKFLASFMAEGGIFLDAQGAEGPVSAMNIPLPFGVLRRVRFSVDVTGNVGSVLRTTGFIELRN